MEKHLRKATESDRHGIALCIAEGFEKDFSVLSPDNKKIAAAIASGLQIDKFYVLEIEGGIAGVIAISDCFGRAAKADKPALRKHLGFLKGLLAGIVLKEEFEGKLSYPATTGYIEFVTVRKPYRGDGAAAYMLKESIGLSIYDEFVLDVTDINTEAIRCYTRAGFREFKRVPEKHAKQKGFEAKIYMRYGKEASV